MSTGESKQETQTQSVNQIPQWVTDAGQQNYAFAQNVANQPLTQYQGQMVADTSPQTQQAWDLAASSGNVGQDQYAASNAGFLNSLGQNIKDVNAGGQTMQVNAGGPTMSVNAGGPTMQVNAGGPTMQVNNPGNARSINAAQLSNTDLSPYINPYTQNVINTTLPIYQQNLGLQQNQAQNAASSAGAFGGSRMGVQQGVTQAQGAQGMAQMAEQLNAANFGQAQAAAQGDVTARNQIATTNQANQQTNLARQLQAQMANQGANAADLNRSLQAQQSNQSANATDLQRSLAAQQSNQSANATDLQRSLTAQQYNQGANAADLSRSLLAQTTNQGAAQAKTNSDILASQGLANLGDSAAKTNAANYTMLSQAGAGQQQQAQDTINSQMAKFQQANAYPQQQLATLLSALGMTPHDTATSGTSSTQTQTPTNWGALALGGLEDLSGFFKASDKTLKTDITKLGKDPQTGLQMHAFRYKGDPKSYPKVVGPMAQEAQQKYPGMVKKQGGKLTVSPALMPTPTIPGALAGPTPPSSPLVAAGIKSLAPRSLASFMPNKKAFGAATAMPRAGAKALHGLANTKFRGALA